MRGDCPVWSYRLTKITDVGGLDAEIESKSRADCGHAHVRARPRFDRSIIRTDINRRSTRQENSQLFCLFSSNHAPLATVASEYQKRTIPVLHAGSYSGDRRTGKIQCALLDSEIVLNSLSKLVSEKILLKWKFYSIIQYGILFNELYCNEMNEKSFKKQFLETFEFTQSWIDEFMLKASKAK